NQFTGPIPNNIGTLSRVVTLSLARNQLEGPVPDSLMSPWWLTHLELAGNGCLTASEVVSDFLTSLDKGWQDGCPLEIETVALPDAQVGQGYEFSLRGSGGTRDYEWGATGLPDGLHLGADGVMGGTPSVGTEGNHSVNIVMQDHKGVKAYKTLNLNVDATP